MIFAAESRQAGMVGEPAGRAARLRVLVVDDSVVMRQLITRILTENTACEVVGTARNGMDAVDKVAHLKPDLVTLDVEMPVLGGLEALRLIKQNDPQVRVIMCSSLTARGASVTVDALLGGADDYVTKQYSGEMHADAYESLRRDLSQKIAAITAKVGRVPNVAASAPRRAANPEAIASRRRVQPQVVAIGVSTGGPAALAELLPRIPAGFSLPLLIVQHMPPLFTQLLAERLARLSSIPVVEGAEGMKVESGCAIIAPGNYHMRVIDRRGSPVITLNQESHENSCRPAVDVLFRSVAEVYGGAALAAILTGMGQDGLEGVRVLKSRGAEVFAQDQQTSVVWGMPGAVVAASLADAILSLPDMASAIARCA